MVAKQSSKSAGVSQTQRGRYEVEQHLAKWPASKKNRRGASKRKPLDLGALILYIMQRLRFWSGLCCLALLLSAPYWGYRYIHEYNPLPIHKVKFVGELTYIARNELSQASQQALDKNFLTFDMDTFQQQLALNPWLNQVKVQRQWPDTLIVKLEENQPFARWGDHELVDVTGKRFTPPLLPLKSWLYLNGPSGFEKVLIERLQQTQALLEPLDLRITAMHMDERHAWTITLNNRLQLLLGKDEFNERLARFVSHYDALLAGQMERIKSIDLRYSSGFAIKWQQIDAEKHIPAVASSPLIKLPIDYLAGY